MTAIDAQTSIKRVTDAQGQTTDVIVPLVLWETLLASWQQMATQLEDQTDRETIVQWLSDRQNGTISTISLADLKAELTRDGLL